MKELRIAILQNRVHKGGRLKVILNMIKSLNELDIIPDIVTSKTQLDKKEIIDKYKEDCKFNFRIIKINIKVPYRWNIIYFNHLIQKIKSEYDLFINSSNSSFFLPNDINIVNYIHYPQKDRILSPKSSINFPDESNKKWLSFNDFPNKVLGYIYKNDVLNRKHEVLIANSEFTKRKILKNYSECQTDDIKVLYPPVEVEKKFADKRKLNNVVVSLGRFSTLKRQLEQIKIANNLKQFEFKILGFKKKKSKYFNKCKKYIENNKIHNVNLMPNVPYDKLKSVLKEATFFIHSTRNEPFGITTVQAISHGCIPVVHDSGGQKEVVPNNDLRYKNISEASDIFLKLTRNSNNYQELMKKLFLNIQRFSASNFKTKFQNIINETIETIK